MKEYKVFENQTWFDVAIHIYGDSSKAIYLADLNNQNITDNLKANQIIKYPNLEENKYVLLSMESNNSIPATAIDEFKINVPKDYGIGEMAIELNFIIK